MDQLAQNVSDMSLNAGQDGDWEKVSKKNKNRGGSSGGRQWGSQAPAPRAWGQQDTAQRLGTRGASGGSWHAPGNGRQQNATPHAGRGVGRGGRPQAVAAPQNGSQQSMTWAARVAPPKANEEKEDVPADEEDDEDDEAGDFSDDEDDNFLSDGGSDETPSSHETLKNHRMLKSFFEMLDKLTLEEINDSDRQWHCPACKGGPGAIDWYRGLQPLTNHARTKGTTRVKLHRLFHRLLEEELRMRGTSAVPAGEVFGNWEGLRRKTKDHEIVWPPMVLIMNTRLEQGDDDKWLGMGGQELVDYFSSYSPVRAKHSYGPQGHRGISLLIFDATAVGYLEAERLHKHFEEQGTDRHAWDTKRSLFIYGGKRQLFGWLATKDDLEMFNRHCQGKQRLKYDLRSYHEKVVSQMKQMSEDNQQLSFYKQKIAIEKREKKAMKDTMGYMTERMKKMSDENRIVKQRSKVHHQQHQEELDFQDGFFREQMEQIQESVNVKEDSFEKYQQDERKKIEDLQSHASTVEDRRRRMEEVKRSIQSQDQRMAQFELERDELQKIHENKHDELKRRHQEEMLALEKAFDASITQLMEKYAPGSTSGDASSHDL